MQLLRLKTSLPYSLRGDGLKVAMHTGRAHLMSCVLGSRGILRTPCAISDSVIYIGR
jgi:hypothetical protein